MKQLKERENAPVILTGTDRVRHWNDGAIIGSKEFLYENMIEFYGEEYADKHRLGHMYAEEQGDGLVYSLRRLHSLK